MSASKMILRSGWAAWSSPSRKPLCRSWPGVDVMRPLSSTIDPLPFSAWATHLPASRPILTLSAPMSVVYSSFSTARSSTMTGMPARNALATGSVSGAASLGLTRMTSTFWAMNSSM